MSEIHQQRERNPSTGASAKPLTEEEAKVNNDLVVKYKAALYTTLKNSSVADKHYAHSKICAARKFVAWANRSGYLLRKENLQTVQQKYIENAPNLYSSNKSHTKDFIDYLRGGRVWLRRNEKKFKSTLLNKSNALLGEDYLNEKNDEATKHNRGLRTYRDIRACVNKFVNECNDMQLALVGMDEQTLHNAISNHLKNEYSNKGHRKQNFCKTYLERFGEWLLKVEKKASAGRLRPASTANIGDSPSAKRYKSNTVTRDLVNSTDAPAIKERAAGPQSLQETHPLPELPTNDQEVEELQKMLDIQANRWNAQVQSASQDSDTDLNAIFEFVDSYDMQDFVSENDGHTRHTNQIASHNQQDVDLQRKR